MIRLCLLILASIKLHRKAPGTGKFFAALVSSTVCESMICAAALASMTWLFNCHAEEEYVTRAEFEKFRQQFEKYKEENEKYKIENEKLKAQNALLETGAKIKKQPIESIIDREMTNDDIPATKDDYLSVKPGTTKFLLSGWADAGYEARPGTNATFTSSFHPEFLWKLDDQISFESDFEIAQIEYHFHDLLTFSAGRFHTPFDQFNVRTYPTWMNKLPDAPLIFDRNSGLVQFSSVGAMLSGGFDAGPTKFNWATYVANGPGLDTSGPSTFGSLDFSSSTDNNQSKTVGGRLGFLPIPELEIGGSVQDGRVGNQPSRQSDVHSMLYGVDFSYNKVFDPIKGVIDLRTEWAWSRVSDAVYSINGSDVFFGNNNRSGGYAQAAYRPEKIDQKWVKNLEIVFRYDRLDNPRFLPGTPVESLATRGSHIRNSMGLNYWLGPTTVLKFSYEKDNGDDHSLLFQFAIGF